MCRTLPYPNPMLMRCNPAELNLGHHVAYHSTTIRCYEAISHGLARSNGKSKRNISMLLSRHGIHLVHQHSQRPDHFWPRFARFNHIVDKPALGGDEGIRESLAKFLHLLLARRLFVFSSH